LNQRSTENISAQGRLADQKLAAAKLILTQGGEPTFVPHDTAAPEWNIAALGPEKLLYARRLARELVATLFPGGAILQSFGKQYPGEPLPRWQVGIYRSRTTGPLWKDVDRLRLDQETVRPANLEMLKQFVEHLARSLKLSNTAVPAYEDFAAALKATASEESTLLLPRFSRAKRAFESRPLTAAARENWSAFFEPAGWALPLDHDGEQWLTSQWKLSLGDDVTLIPGDSPIGLRLPLSHLSDGALRRALTVEIRDGELIVFIPPLPSFAAFAELVRRVELVVVELDLPPLRLEGYAPSGDDDLESIGLTSDPGVLEVNLPPADNWPEYERIIHGLFASAEAVGMRGFKYQMSGRKVSTGGGAHIILGGPDRARNPFILCPTLFSSFIRFLQHHPALSFAFSGLFTGPSSQAPRVDESAYDLPYELEMTLRAVEAMPRPGDPVMLDAMLRNLLMDWNGNTHRAELSVDKFQNFNAPGGTRGLIEFRAFEMVPEPALLLAANALLRALAACFVEKPFSLPLVDWREALHDKFALPWLLRSNLRDVLAFVNGHGFDFALEAFDAQLDFRFPIITRFEAGGGRWTLRQALEPWPVMGEHQGTGRVVDASTDRLELLVQGMAPDSNLAVGVNGLRLPLVPAGHDAAVGAIRYRLVDNPWGLQPHVQAHTPLSFEIIDLKRQQVIHAFDYLNWKPEGGNYDAPPRTDDEARQRVERRLVMKPSGGPASLRDVPASDRAPYTLDLRRF
jgi:uncharacterized protein (DUF2126 family)